MAKAQTIAEPAVPQIMVTREFAAPHELLFRADTDPDLLVQPLGPRELTLAMDYCDPRHDGTWRYTSSDGEGNECSFRSVFHGGPPPDGIVQASEFEKVCRVTSAYA